MGKTYCTKLENGKMGELGSIPKGDSSVIISKVLFKRFSKILILASFSSNPWGGSINCTSESV